MKKIVAVGAHSDDLEFYAGGTLAKATRENEVVLVIATDGRYGTHAGLTVDELIEMRRLEQIEAAKILGITKTIFLGFADGELEFHIRELKKELLKVLVIEKPDIVFSFDPERQAVVHEDFHPDHRVLASALMDVLLIDATLPLKGGLVDFKPTVYLYNAQHPNISNDISENLLTKKSALEVYGSQVDVLSSQTQKDERSEKFRKYPFEDGLIL